MPDFYVPLDVNYQDDDKIMWVGAAAELVYVRAMALAKRLGTDGVIRTSQLRRLTDDLTQRDTGRAEDPTEEWLAARLVTAGLWRETDEGWLIASWPKHNKTRADIDADRAAEAERKRAWRAKQRDVDVPRDATTASGGRDEGATHSEVDSDSEVKGEGDTEVAPARKRATRAPETFEVTEDLAAWARSKGIRVSLTAETERFLDHHRAKGTLFKDWPAGWRKWMSNADDFRPARANGVSQYVDDGLAL